MSDPQQHVDWQIKSMKSTFAGHQPNVSDTANQYAEYNIQYVTLNCPRNPHSFVSLTIERKEKDVYNRYIPILFKPTHRSTCQSQLVKPPAEFEQTMLMIEEKTVSKFFLQVKVNSRLKASVTLLECVNGSKHTVSTYRTENSSLQFFTNGCQQCLLIVELPFESVMATMFGEVPVIDVSIRICEVPDDTDIYNMSVTTSLSVNR